MWPVTWKCWQVRGKKYLNPRMWGNSCQRSKCKTRLITIDGIGGLIDIIRLIGLASLQQNQVRTRALQQLLSYLVHAFPRASVTRAKQETRFRRTKHQEYPLDPYGGGRPALLVFDCHGRRPSNRGYHGSYRNYHGHWLVSRVCYGLAESQLNGFLTFSAP